MITRMVGTASAALSAGLLLFSMASPRADNEDGIVRVKSAYSLVETVNRLKKDVADKDIMFFSRLTNPSSPRKPASNSCHRHCWSSAILRSESSF
jgi:hypothetical protein